MFRDIILVFILVCKGKSVLFYCEMEFITSCLLRYFIDIFIKGISVCRIAKEKQPQPTRFSNLNTLVFGLEIHFKVIL